MIVFVSALLLVTPDDTAQRARAWAAKARPFTQCVIGVDCDRKWKLAKKWVWENTRFKIAVDEPDLYSTPGAIYANTDLSFTLTMTNTEGNQRNINVFAWCGNVISCKPSPKKAVAELMRATG